MKVLLRLIDAATKSFVFYGKSKSEKSKADNQWQTAFDPRGTLPVVPTSNSNQAK